MLRFLVLITPLFWAVVLYLMWQRQKHRRLQGSKSLPKNGAGKNPQSTKLARVIVLYPDPPPSASAHLNEDHPD